MIQKTLVLVLLSCLSLSILTGEQPAQPGIIILLNGTSAAGKSSLIKELQKQSEDAFFVISFDDFISKYDKPVCTYLDIVERDDAFFQYIKNSSKIYDKVLVDVVDYETVFEKYDALLGDSLVKILVYCPLQDLIKRVEKRNHEPQYKNEHLKLFLAFTQFLSLYQNQSTTDEVLVDTIRAADIKNMLRAIKKELDNFDRNHPEVDPEYLPKSMHERAEKYNNLVKDAVTQFHYNRQRKITLSLRHQIWDFVINSGANSPEQAARKIADFLQN